MPVPARHELFCAAGLDLDRPAGPLRENRRDDCQACLVLVSKAGAHVRPDYPHEVLGQVQREGEAYLVGKDAAAGLPDGQAALLPRCDGNPRLQRRTRVGLRGEGLLEDPVGLRKALVDVAAR